MSEHDAGLIEMACAVYSRVLTDTLDPTKAMRAVFDAVNASGTHWLAPSEPTEAMMAASRAAREACLWPLAYHDMRDTYLTEQAKEPD